MVAFGATCYFIDFLTPLMNTFGAPFRRMLIRLPLGVTEELYFSPLLWLLLLLDVDEVVVEVEVELVDEDEDELGLESAAWR